MNEHEKDFALKFINEPPKVDVNDKMNSCYGGESNHRGIVNFPDEKPCPLCSAIKELHQLEEDNREMKGILKLVEWSNDTRGFKFCPMCGNLRPNHSTHCRLSKILNRK